MEYAPELIGASFLWRSCCHRLKRSCQVAKMLEKVETAIWLIKILGKVCWLGEKSPASFAEVLCWLLQKIAKISYCALLHSIQQLYIMQAYELPPGALKAHHFLTRAILLRSSKNRKPHTTCPKPHQLKIPTSKPNSLVFLFYSTQCQNLTVYPQPLLRLR